MTERTRMRNVVPNIVTAIASIVLATAVVDPAVAAGATPQAMAISKTVPDSAQSVCRSAAETRRALGAEHAAMAKALHLEAIDYSKKMVIVVRAGRVNAFGVRLSVTDFTRADDSKTATVDWLYKPYFGGAAPPDQPGNPTLAAVLDRFDGPVKFRRKNWQYPKGLPLPPSAPPSQPQAPVRQ